MKSTLRVPMASARDDSSAATYSEQDGGDLRAQIVAAHQRLAERGDTITAEQLVIARDVLPAVFDAAMEACAVRAVVYHPGTRVVRFKRAVTDEHENPTRQLGVEVVRAGDSAGYRIRLSGTIRRGGRELDDGYRPEERPPSWDALTSDERTLPRVVVECGCSRQQQAGTQNCTAMRGASLLTRSFVRAPQVIRCMKHAIIGSRTALSSARLC